MDAQRKVRTNISLDPKVAAAARELGLNVSAVSEAALREEVSRARARQWAEENAGVLEEQEAWLRKHGHPLKEFLPDWAREAWDEWMADPKSEPEAGRPAA